MTPADDYCLLLVYLSLDLLTDLTFALSLCTNGTVHRPLVSLSGLLVIVNLIVCVRIKKPTTRYTCLPCYSYLKIQGGISPFKFLEQVLPLTQEIKAP